MSNPNPLRKFQPGQSGNPGGRPRLNPELKEMLRTASLSAFQYLVGLIGDPRARVTDKIKACEILIERTYGKTPQPIIGDEAASAIVIRLTGDLEAWGK